MEVNDAADQSPDPMLADAVPVIEEYDRASASLLQRRLNLNYERACRLVDELEARGYLGPFDGSNARQVLHREPHVAPDAGATGAKEAQGAPARGATITPEARAAGESSSRGPAVAVIAFVALVVAAFVTFGGRGEPPETPVIGAVTSPSSASRIAMATTRPTRTNSPEVAPPTSEATEPPAATIRPTVRPAATRTSDALSQMEIAFVGTPRQSEIKAKLDAALAMYGLQPTEDNYSRAGSTLVALRISATERGCDACTEIAILGQMLRDGALPGADFPDHAAYAATLLELE
jgi:hypothetical protein